MQYMDLVIVKGDFNDRYDNNATWVGLIIQDTIINDVIEGRDWSLCETCLLSSKPLVYSDTFLDSYSDIIIFQERERLEIRPSGIF